MPNGDNGDKLKISALNHRNILQSADPLAPLPTPRLPGQGILRN
jgi:hypothetical protein